MLTLAWSWLFDLYVPWLIRVCAMTHSSVWQHLSMLMNWGGQDPNCHKEIFSGCLEMILSHLRIWRDSRVHVQWFIYLRASTHPTLLRGEGLDLNYLEISSVHVEKWSSLIFVCVRCFVLWNRSWGIVTVPGFDHERANGDAPTIRNRLLTLSPFR